jgi:CRP/FNR family cyclic AMP-dependent transcriptional regulator
MRWRAASAHRRARHPMARTKPLDTSDPLQDPALDGAMSDALRSLAARGELRRYRRGTLLIEEGDHGDTLYVILSGKVRAFSTGATDRQVTYGVYGPGEYFGEMSLDGGPRSASVEVVESCACAVVSRQTLEQYLADHPRFAFELISKVIRRARAATLSTKQLALNDVYGRLKLLLESLAARQPDGTQFIAGRLTHNDIATRLGCSREMVSRLLKDLNAGGYVRAEPSGFRLTRDLPPRW